MPRHHHLLLLLLVLFAGGLLAAAVATSSPGLPKQSCSTGQLAGHINVLAFEDPITASDRAGESCAGVRAGVDSSLAATGDVIPCLCLLDDYQFFLFTGLCIEDVPDEMYVPCGGKHAPEARLLAARCEGILGAIRGRMAPSPTSSSHGLAPSPSEKENGGAVPRVEAIYTGL